MPNGQNREGLEFSAEMSFQISKVLDDFLGLFEHSTQLMIVERLLSMENQPTELTSALNRMHQLLLEEQNYTIDKDEDDD